MKELFVNNIQELEDWLSQNWNQTESIWLIHYKFTSGLTDITRENLVDTLLCFGWIDSLPGKVDSTKTKIRISPRNPKSAWSKINKDKVEKLIQNNKMKKSGLDIIQLAKQNGAWNKLDQVENLIVPEDMQVFLFQHNLQKVWDSYSNSKKRGLLEFLLNRKSRSARQKFLNTIFPTQISEN